MHIVILLTLKASHASNVGVYVRWITPGRALDYLKPVRNPAGCTPIQPSTTVAQFKHISTRRVYKAANANETALVPPFRLWPVSYCMSNINHRGAHHNSCGYRMYGKPRTAVVILHCSRLVPIRWMKERPQSLWPFGCSDRGIATFQTCLRAFMAEARGSANVSRRSGRRNLPNHTLSSGFGRHSR